MKSLRKESNRPAAVALALLGSFLLSGGALGANYPAPVQGDYVIRNFEFARSKTTVSGLACCVKSKTTVSGWHVA